MSYGLYLDEELVAPLREAPHWGPAPGQVGFHVSAVFLADPALLKTASLAVEDEAAAEPVPVKCLDYHGDSAVLYVRGCALETPGSPAARFAEDWLISAGEALERLRWFRRSAESGGPCVLSCSYRAWRTLGLRARDRPCACQRCPVGRLLTAPVAPDPARWIGEGPLTFEVVRLRERCRVHVEPFAAHFAASEVQILGKARAEHALGRAP
jgi:hypothetical protein